MITEKEKGELLKKKNVVGVGTGYKYVGGRRTDEVAIIVFVRRKVPESELSSRDLIPKEIRGVKTDVREKFFRAFTTPEEKQKKWRPAKGGCSISHFLVTAGTLGAIVTDKTDGEKVILSNNHVLANCLDENTDVLTETGWKNWDDVTENDKLATLNKRGELEYQKPLALHKYWYNGDLIHFSSKYMDLMVTPNHRLYAKHTFRSGIPKHCRHLQKYTKFSFILAEDAYKRMYNHPSTSFAMTSFIRWNCLSLNAITIPEVKYIKGKDYNVKTQIPTRLWARFLGWYLSEGSYAINPNGGYLVSIRNCNLDYINEIHRLMEEMGFNAFICKSGKGYAVVVNSKQLYTYVKQFGHTEDKYIPQDLKQAPPDILSEFMDAYLKGDGGKYHKYYCACSKSKRLIDDLQEVFLKLGYHSQIKVIKGSTFNPNGIYYWITAYRLKEMRVMKVAKFHYTGYVYCATVPNGTLLVRRNGKPVWTANSNNGKAGDSILQPGVYDGSNVSTDTIAKLKRFVPIQFEQGSTCPVANLLASLYNGLARIAGARTRLVLTKEVYNEVDAAIASPLDPSLVEEEIIDVGAPKGLADAVLGMRVQKSGRTTCKTVGIVDTVDLTVRVSYDYNTAVFVDQIGIQPEGGKFSDGGDSGSAILDMDANLIGLLFAGDDSGYTIANKIGKVFDALGVKLS